MGLWYFGTFGTFSLNERIQTYVFTFTIYSLSVVSESIFIHFIVDDNMIYCSNQNRSSGIVESL